MATLIKRGKVWYAYWWQGSKKKWKALSPLKSEANRKLADIERQAEAVKYGHQHIGISWRGFVDQYLKYCQTNKKEKTCDRDRLTIRKFTESFTPQGPESLTVTLLEEYKAQRRVDGVKDSTINRDLGLLKAMVRKAFEWGYLIQNHAGKVKKLKIGKNPPRFFQNDEIRAILSACYDEFERILVNIGIYTGLRREEIARLKWEDIAMDTKKVKIVGRDGWTPKDYEAREIPLHPKLETELLKWKRKNGRAPYILALNDRKQDGVYLYHVFKRTLRRCGITGTFQTMRHTFASILVNSGVDIYTVSKWLGHASIKTTEIYAHLQPSTQYESIKKIDYSVA